MSVRTFPGFVTSYELCGGAALRSGSRISSFRRGIPPSNIIIGSDLAGENLKAHAPARFVTPPSPP